MAVDAVRSAVTPALPPPVDGDPPALVPFDDRAKKVLELTFREALRLDHGHVGTEHILLALLELEGGSGPLTGLGVDKATAESYAVGALSAEQGPEAPGDRA